MCFFIKPDEAARTMGGHLPGCLLQLSADVRLVSIVLEAAHDACFVPAGKSELQHVEQQPAEGKEQPARSNTGALHGPCRGLCATLRSWCLGIHDGEPRVWIWGQDQVIQKFPSFSIFLLFSVDR